jgi:Zn-dependent M16 (insulinase) family peptidase
VIGGAYGGFASISPSGSFKMSSYRDPNLQSTLDNFNQTGSYLEKFSADHSAMTRYIIGTISELDTPLTASQKADQAFSNLLTGKTLDLARQEREEVLSATVADLNEFSGMVNDLVAADIHCVYGDATLLDNHAGLFRNLINLGNQNG